VDCGIVGSQPAYMSYGLDGSVRDPPVLAPSVTSRKAGVAFGSSKDYERITLRFSRSLSPAGFSLALAPAG